MSASTWERIVEARTEADKDLSILSKLSEWAKARMERDLIRGRLPDWQVDQAVEMLLEEQGVSGYTSVALGLARLNDREEAAQDAEMLAKRIADGLVPYDRFIDGFYQGFSALFQHASGEFRKRTYNTKAVA